MKQIGLISVEEMILISISASRKYGLEMIRNIKDVTHGERKISFGSMYPALYKLEKLKMIKSEWGDEKKSNGARRRYYKITAKGQSALLEAKSLRRWLGSYL